MNFTIIVVRSDEEPQTWTVRGAKKAYALYDQAIANGLSVLQFTNKSGTDYRDRTSEEPEVRLN